MRKAEANEHIPVELMGEDVYNILYFFDNENEAIDYVTKTYGVEEEKVISELYEEENMRQKYGKKDYLRSASIQNPEKIISELMSGEYVLWEAY